MFLLFSCACTLYHFQVQVHGILYLGAVENSDGLFHTMNTREGSSGAPILNAHGVVAVHLGVDTDNPKVKRAINIQAVIRAFINEDPKSPNDLPVDGRHVCLSTSTENNSIYYFKFALLLYVVNYIS